MTKDQQSLEVSWVYVITFLIMIVAVPVGYINHQVEKQGQTLDQKADKRDVEREHQEFQQTFKELRQGQEDIKNILIEKLGPPDTRRPRRDNR